MWLGPGKLYLVVLVLSLLREASPDRGRFIDAVRQSLKEAFSFNANGPGEPEVTGLEFITFGFYRAKPHKYDRTAYLSWSFLPHMSKKCLAMYEKDGSSRKGKKQEKFSQCKEGDADTKYCYRGECVERGRCVCCPPLIPEYLEFYKEFISGKRGGYEGPTCSVWVSLNELQQQPEYIKWRSELDESVEFTVPPVIHEEENHVDIASIVQADGDHRNYEPMKTKKKDCEILTATCYRGLCKNDYCTDCFVYDGSSGGLPGKYHGEHCDIFIPDSIYDAEYEASSCNFGKRSDVCDDHYCSKAGKCWCDEHEAVGAYCQHQIDMKTFCPNDCSRDKRRGKCKKVDGSNQRRCICNEGFDGIACEKTFQCIDNSTGIDLCETGKCKPGTVRGVRTQFCQCDRRLYVGTVGKLCREFSAYCGTFFCFGERSKCRKTSENTYYCDCGPGRTGPTCNERCDDTKFGRNCAKDCILLGYHCKGPCDDELGDCRGGCWEGYRRDRKNGRDGRNYCNETVWEELVVQTEFTMSSSTARKRAADSQDAEIIEKLKDENSNLSKTYQDNLHQLMVKIAKKEEIASVRLEITGFELGSVITFFDVAFPPDEVGETDLNDLLETGLVEEADDFDPGLGKGYTIVKDSIKTSEASLRTVTRDDDSSTTALIGGVVGAVGFVVVVAVVAVKVKSNQNELAKKKEKGKHAGKKRSKRGSTASNMDSKSDDNVKDKRSAVSKKSKSTKGSKSNKKVASSTA